MSRLFVMIACLSLSFSAFADTQTVNGLNAITSIVNILKGDNSFPAIGDEDFELAGKTQQGRACSVRVTVNELGLQVSIIKALGGTELAQVSVPAQTDSVEVVDQGMSWGGPSPFDPTGPAAAKTLNLTFYVLDSTGSDDSINLADSFASLGSPDKVIAVTLQSAAKTASCNVTVANQ